MLRIIPFAHEVLRQYVKDDSVVIDMTCGNGHDTKFITTLPAKKILSFDIQEQALNKAKTLNDDDRIEFILDSHENVSDYIDEFDVAIFNLGYLPGSDKTITTTKDTTISAISNLISIGGDSFLIIIVVYPGHEEGRIESLAINDFLDNLSDFEISKYQLINKDTAPYVFIVKK